MITLSSIRPFKVPIDAACITPDTFSGKTKEEISDLPIWEGKCKVKLKDLFKIEVDGTVEKEVSIKVSGDLRKVRRIGAGMSSGSITVQGDVGNHLGEGMKGERLSLRETRAYGQAR